jgi:hypothetical protein
LVDRLVVRSVVRSVVNFNSYADSVHFERKKKVRWAVMEF